MMKKEIIIKPLTECIFVLSNNYIEYESNGDRNKTLLVEEYSNKIKAYLEKNNLRKSNTNKTQIAIAISLIPSKDNDEKCVMN